MHFVRVCGACNKSETTTITIQLYLLVEQVCDNLSLLFSKRSCLQLLSSNMYDSDYHNWPIDPTC